jgi:spectinomycin phosphotransferase
MLERPDLEDGRIIVCLEADYGLAVATLAFLPLGADMNTAVYRAETIDGGSFFVKLRAGPFDPNTVLVPWFLRDIGIRPIIPPLKSTGGRLWAKIESFRVILYPYVTGRDGFEVKLMPHHWRELGVALRAIHATTLPPELAGAVRQDDYKPHWRNTVLLMLENLDDQHDYDGTARMLGAFLMFKRPEILDLVDHAERYAYYLQTHPPTLVLCHTDLHAGNVLISEDGAFYILDWDNPLFAPRERDLMFIGGAQGFIGDTPEDEETYFYQGYGPVDIDPVALAYYRFERIIEDIALFCQQLLLSDAGGEDRPRALRYVMSNFTAGGTIDAAYRAIRPTD